MAEYAIGDVQGCFGELRLLLNKIGFDPRHDLVYFVGDIVNRGPQSLETLRFIKNMGESAVTVLGNHDLHLLSVAYGASKTKRRDTFGDILGAPDRDGLLDWLRMRPLLHLTSEFYLIHAGLPPQWDMETAARCAREVETVLRGDAAGEFFQRMYGDKPDRWSENLEGWPRLRFITNCFTRLRYCDRNGVLDMKEKGAPGSQESPHLMPWFKVQGRASESAKIIFGHWSTLGYHVEQNCHCLDTGCLWGGKLTAMRLDGDNGVFSVGSINGPHQLPVD
ncbi:MAG: diadenosine tetraphosphatase [Candidatus Methylumidiphilus alinenensis]|uniref:Bis(5'-nucleosyl)-tetraphosphatase, symmetrical n=1 Tax=Candidatus Methylumidiphilus alinenensis TaxID=2202197 RepID=A0A2W4R3R0_9GAMM|nr:MAG: diadenosine tetraphosphatase [Candidatus Methylumidiphilus alinenensis]